MFGIPDDLAKLNKWSIFVPFYGMENIFSTVATENLTFKCWNIIKTFQVTKCFIMTMCRLFGAIGMNPQTSFLFGNRVSLSQHQPCAYYFILYLDKIYKHIDQLLIYLITSTVTSIYSFYLNITFLSMFVFKLPFDIIYNNVN